MKVIWRLVLEHPYRDLHQRPFLDEEEGGSDVAEEELGAVVEEGVSGVVGDGRYVGVGQSNMMVEGVR